MNTIINLSEFAKVNIIECEIFSPRLLLSRLLEHPITSTYSVFKPLDVDEIYIDDFLLWEKDFTLFMSKRDFLILIS